MNEKLAKKILIKTKQKIFNFKHGDTQSLFSGEGMDFKEIKEYNQGDNVKKINWKVTAKMNGSPFINVFNEEKQLNIINIFLINGNNEYKNKKEKMGEVLSLLSLSAINSKDIVSNIFFSDKVEKQFLKTKNTGMVLKSLNYIFDNNFLGKETNYNELVKYISKTIKKKSIIFIIGDFYNEDIDFKETGFKHEIYPIVLRDKTEEKPSLLGELNIIDPINMKNENIYFNNNIINKFEIKMNKNNMHLLKSFKKNKLKYLKLYTDEDIFYKIKTLFKK